MRTIPWILSAFGLAALCLMPTNARAQDSIPFYEFGSAALDYPAEAAGLSYTLQGTLGQTFVTVDTPTNTGQDLVLLGFWMTETLFPFNIITPQPIRPLPPPSPHGPPIMR